MASLLVLATTRQQLHPQSAAYSERRALWPDSLCQGVWQQTLEKSAYLRRLNIKTILFPSHCQVQLLRAFKCTKRKHFPHLQCVFTFDRAAEDVSPAGIVNGPSTCPGETYQPGHSIWPLLETVYHLFHRESTVNRILLFLCMATTLFLNKCHVQGCGSANTEMMGILNNIAKFLAIIAICISHTEVEDFLDIFLRWFMEVWKHEMSLQRHLQFGHGNANLLISSSNTLCFQSDINETLSFVMFPVIYWQDENYQKHDAISWGETLTEVTITEWLVFPEGFPSANCRRREGQLRQARWIIIA